MLTSVLPENLVLSFGSAMEKYLYDLMNKGFLNFLPFDIFDEFSKVQKKNHKIGKKIGISKEIQTVFNLRKKWFYLGTWKADFGYLPDPSLLMVIIYLALFRIFFDGRQRFKGEKRRREICYVVKYFPV